MKYTDFFNDLRNEMSEGDNLVQIIGKLLSFLEKKKNYSEKTKMWYNEVLNLKANAKELEKKERLNISNQEDITKKNVIRVSIIKIIEEAENYYSSVETKNSIDKRDETQISEMEIKKAKSKKHMEENAPIIENKLSYVICIDIFKSSFLNDEETLSCILLMDEIVEAVLNEKKFQATSVDRLDKYKYSVQNSGDGRTLFLTDISVRELLSISETIIKKYNSKLKLKSIAGRLKIGISIGNFWYKEVNEDKNLNKNIVTLGGPAIVNVERIQGFGVADSILIDYSAVEAGNLKDLALSKPIQIRDKNGVSRRICKFGVQSGIIKEGKALYKLISILLGLIVLLAVSVIIWQKQSNDIKSVILIGSGTVNNYINENMPKHKDYSNIIHTSSGVAKKILNGINRDKNESPVLMLSMSSQYFSDKDFLQSPADFTHYQNFKILGIPISEEEDTIQVVFGIKKSLWENDNQIFANTFSGFDPSSNKINYSQLADWVMRKDPNWSSISLEHPFVVFATSEESGTKNLYKDSLVKTSTDTIFFPSNIHEFNAKGEETIAVPSDLNSPWVVLGSKYYTLSDESIKKNRFHAYRFNISTRPLLFYCKVKIINSSPVEGCIEKEICDFLKRHFDRKEKSSGKTIGNSEKFLRKKDMCDCVISIPGGTNHYAVFHPEDLQ
jgi:predicted DNA-binding protein